jgi:hypothetical protein
MLLKVMKKHIKLLILVFFPFCLIGQVSAFKSYPYKQFSNYFLDTITSSDSDTTQHIELGSRINSQISYHDNKKYSSLLVGKVFSANLRNKITLNSNLDYLIGDFHPLNQHLADSLNLYFPTYGDKRFRWQFNLKYKLNKFIVADIGKGRHFIGNGYRSLLLSDGQTPYPYLKIETEFGRVKYYNLYTTFLNPNQADYGRKKHATIHYLDFAITDKINFGVFESILWQSKSEEVNKGFEFAYLNPIIFYRPVEFSKHSSKGNALMGVNANATFNTTVLYGQAVLDDLNISRQKDSDEEDYEEGYFQNKFGFQIGVKTKYKGVDLLAEYNQVQPYTYGHRTILQNYSHMNQALAHPMGANFKEVVLMANYKKDKWMYSIKVTTAKVGLDSLDTHYGQNIFESDYEASTGGQHSYGNFNEQGVLTQLNTLHAEVSYEYKGFDIFGSVFYKSKKSDLVDQTSLFYSLGLRTFPFSTFTDY